MVVYFKAGIGAARLLARHHVADSDASATVLLDAPHVNSGDDFVALGADFRLLDFLRLLLLLDWL